MGIAAAGLRIPATALGQAAHTPKPLPEATPKKLPRWRGFNLLNKFMATAQKPFDERDFADIAELGFDFVRLPLDYLCWTDPGNLKVLKESALKEIDQAVELGKKHGIHVQINFYRAPGFTVAKPAEPKSIWSDQGILCLRPSMVCIRGAVFRAAEQRG
jgi:endoglucanase